MPDKYEGVHSFLFLFEGEEPSPETVIAALKEIVDPVNGPVFFAELFEGDFRGFAHIAEDSLEALGALIDGDLWDRGLRSDHDTETTVYTSSAGMRMAPKRGSPRFCAICRLKTTQRPTSVMRAIAESFGEAPPFIGASTVVGRFKLLVELGADSREELDGAVRQLLEVDGVAPDPEVGIAELGAAAV